MFLDQCAALRLAALRGLARPALGQFPELVMRPILIFLLCLILSAVFTGSLTVKSVFIAVFCAALINMAFGIVVLRRVAPPEMCTSPPTYQVKSWMVSAIWISLNASVLVLNVQVDLLMLGALTTFSDVGVYRVAVQMSLIVALPNAVFNLIALQRFSALLGEGNLAAVRKTSKLLATSVTICAGVLTLGFYSVGSEGLSKIFGDDFATAITPLLILALGQCALAMFGMPNNLLIAANKERVLFPVSCAALLVNIVCTYALIPSFGLAGAAIASVMSSLGWSIALWWITRRQLNIDTGVFARITQ